jgi:hypothetical protein
VFHPTAAITTTSLVTPVFVVTPDLILSTYSAQAAPAGMPIKPSHDSALDVTLTWHLPTGVWPEGVAISVRPTHQGASQIDPATGQPVQVDRPRPLNGLWVDTPVKRDVDRPVVVHDPYRLPQPPTLENQADGLLLILYRQTDNGFENIAELPLPLPPPTAVTRP